MPRFSLTDFVDIVVSSGTPKANKVRNIKNRPPYNPAFDFYKPLRDHIVQIHRLGKSKANINALMPSITDKKKLNVYPVLIDGYRKWWGKKVLVWFDPPNGIYHQHGIDISVNPELGLEIAGKPYLIKLYFKKERLTKNRIDVIHFLMDDQLSNSSPANTSMAVLEIRQSKLYIPTVSIQNLPAILSAELAYIAALWPEM